MAALIVRCCLLFVGCWLLRVESCCSLVCVVVCCRVSHICAMCCSLSNANRRCCAFVVVMGCSSLCVVCVRLLIVVYCLSFDDDVRRC